MRGWSGSFFLASVFYGAVDKILCADFVSDLSSPSPIKGNGFSPFLKATLFCTILALATIIQGASVSASPAFDTVLSQVDQVFIRGNGWQYQDVEDSRPVDLAVMVGLVLRTQITYVEQNNAFQEPFTALQHEMQEYMDQVAAHATLHYDQAGTRIDGEGLWRTCVSAMTTNTYDIISTQQFHVNPNNLSFPNLLATSSGISAAHQNRDTNLFSDNYEPPQPLKDPSSRIAPLPEERRQDFTSGRGLLDQVAPHVRVGQEAQTENQMPPKPEISYDDIGGVWINPDNGEPMLEFTPGNQVGQYIGRYLKNMNLMANPYEAAKPSSLCRWVTTRRGPYNGVVGKGVAHQGDMVFNNKKISYFTAGIYWLYSSDRKRWVLCMKFTGKNPNALWTSLEYRLEKR